MQCLVQNSNYKGWARKRARKKTAASLEISGGGFYIPMDGAWDSKEDDNAFKLASKRFDELRPMHPYVVLIKSCHWVTHGYWVEVTKKEVSFPDRIIKGGETIKL